MIKIVSFPRIAVDTIANKKISYDCRIKLRLHNWIRFTTGSDISHCYYENNTPARFRFKSSGSQMICKIGVLKNSTKLAGQKLCWSHFLIKLQALRSATLSKRNSWRSPWRL